MEDNKGTFEKVSRSNNVRMAQDLDVRRVDREKIQSEVAYKETEVFDKILAWHAFKGLEGLIK